MRMPSARSMHSGRGERRKRFKQEKKENSGAAIPVNNWFASPAVILRVSAAGTEGDSGSGRI